MLEIISMTSRIPENTDWEWFLLICRTKPAHSRCHGVHSRTRDAGTANTSQPELIATPQFDSGRWKLHLERAPIATDKKFAAPIVSRVAIGFTMLSPLIFIIVTYVWASLVG
jgi:hypothetical protein